MQRKSAQYQITMVLLLSINFGVLFFDRQALNFLLGIVCILYHHHIIK